MLSTSESLPSTLIVTDMSSSVVALSFTATGASFTAVTVTVTVAVSVSIPSLSVYLKLSVPLKFAAGVYCSWPDGKVVTVPFAGCVTLATLWLGPSTSVSLLRTEIVTGVSSVVDAVSSPATGASFSASTETDTVVVAVSSPSLTVYWNVSTPLKFSSGA